jgi:hypothetical protein
MYTIFWLQNLKGTDHSIGVDGRITLEWIRETWWEGWTGCSWLRIGSNGGSCEHRNGLSGSIKDGEFFD